jgi:hypothetical protein
VKGVGFAFDFTYRYANKDLVIPSTINSRYILGTYAMTLKKKQKKTNNDLFIKEDFLKIDKIQQLPG